MMEQAVLWSHEVTLPGDPVSVLRARRFVVAHLVEHRLFYLVEDVRLVVSELATGTIRRTQAPFTVTLEGVDDEVRLKVQGDPSKLRAEQEAAETSRRRALSIVDFLTRDWGVTETPDGSMWVWASFATRPR